VLAGNRDDHEALVGRAQVSAWRGDLGAAERGYRTVLARNPGNTDALAGLGYVYHWQARDGPAGRMAERALAIDSIHQGARELREAVRRATRSTVETAANWSNDSDRNTTWGQSVTASAPVADGVRVFGSAAVLEASDPFRNATGLGGDAGLSWAVGRIQLTGAAGARRLDPDVAQPRTSATYRARISYRPVPTLGVSLGYHRYPFDEIAALMERDLDLEVLDAGFDARLTPGLSLYGSGGAVWLSDGNRRSGALGGITQTIEQRFFAGLFGRTLGYDRQGIGYFSPDEFTVLEAVGGYRLDGGRWTGRLSGGLGAQRIGAGGEAQTEWHVEGRLGRQWGTGNRIEVFGLVTNSAVSSTSGAFRYRSAGVTLRLGR